MPDDLLSLADELYGLAPGDFTPRRDALAKEHKGDKELAAKIKALKKPTMAAWVVNVFARREADQVAQVLEVGKALRDAQAKLDGEELRALTRQRRQLTAAVTSQARAVAAEYGQKVTQAVADQVEATLTAAMVDERAAEAVRSGLLLQPLSTTGLGETEIAVAVPEAFGFTTSATTAPEATRPDLHLVPDPDAEEKAAARAREQAAARVKEVERELKRASKAYDDAVTEVADLEAETIKVQSELDELRRRISDLEERAEEIDDEITDAEDVRDEAEGALAEIQTRYDAAQAVLDELS